MSSGQIVSDYLFRFGENEMIISNELYRNELSSQMRIEAYYKALQRMCEKGELDKIAKGIYYKPKRTKYGVIPPSDQDIIQAFTKDHTGTVIGYVLYNRLGLTTQISRTVQVLSSKLDGQTKNIRNINVRYADLDFTDKNVKLIQGMNVLENFDKIQDKDYHAVIDYFDTLADQYDDGIFEYVHSELHYRKATISFLKEILTFYGVTNRLDIYLSALSNYKHATMEEIYEAARVS